MEFIVPLMLAIASAACAISSMVYANKIIKISRHNIELARAEREKYRKAYNDLYRKL